MNDENYTDAFGIDELSFISRVVSDGTLYGFNLDLAAMINPEFESEAIQSLKNKGILDDSGKITEDGAYIFQAIEDYTNSDLVIKINNLYIAQIPDNDSQVVAILEYANQIYQLFVVDKIIALKELVVSFPILQREPDESEQKFLEKRARNSEKREMPNVKDLNEVLKIEVLNQKKNSFNNEVIYYYQFNDEVYETYDLEMNKVQKVSQYWLMGQIYRSVGINFDKELVNNGKE